MNGKSSGAGQQLQQSFSVAQRHKENKTKHQQKLVITKDEHTEFDQLWQQQQQQSKSIVRQNDWQQDFKRFNINEQQLDFSAMNRVFEEHQQQQQRNDFDWEREFQRYSASQPQFEDAHLEQALNQVWDSHAQSAMQYSNEMQFEESWQQALNEPLMSQPNFDESARPPTEYQFEPQNQYLNHTNPLQLAQELQQRSEPLTLIALALEAACQQDLTNQQAWTRLGMVQAENEKERAAILALEKAHQLNPQSLDTMMALAVSYTNESMDDEAIHVLAKWLVAKYPQQNQMAGTDLTGMPTYELYDLASREYLKVARQHGTQDADLQIGMGILYYNTSQYDKSIDCFEMALQLRPDDYLLWNRMGATLANSGKSEQAIESYHRALSLQPNFIRARYNLGVSCLNIGCYREAVEHFLTALATQDNRHQKLSVNMYETLRRTLTLMERDDLALLAVDGVDVSLFRKHFDF